MCLNNLLIECSLVEGQPDSIVQDIENMVRSYVEKVSLKKFHLFHPI